MIDKKRLAKSNITPEQLGYVTGAMAQTLDGSFDGQIDDPNKHLKELLTTDGDVRGKTDLSVKQINAMVKLRYIAKLLGQVAVDKDGKELTDKYGNVILIPDAIINEILDEFITLRISKDRKSRGEFVDGIKGSSPNQQRNGFFNALGGVFR